MDVTLTIALPTTRDPPDGATVQPKDIGGLHISRIDGTGAPSVIATLQGPFTSPTMTYVDRNVPPGSHGYECNAFDSKEGDMSDVFPVVVAAPLAPLAAPTIVSATQA